MSFIQPCLKWVVNTWQRRLLAGLLLRDAIFVVYFWYLYLIKKEKGPLLHQWGLFFIHQGRDGPQGPISPLHTPGQTDLTSSQHKCFISQRYTVIGLHNEEVRHRLSNSQKQGQATDAVHTYLWSDDSGQSGLRWGRVWPFWPYIQRDALLYYHTIAVYQTTLYYTAPLNINCVIIYCNNRDALNKQSCCGGGEPAMHMWSMAILTKTKYYMSLVKVLWPCQ